MTAAPLVSVVIVTRNREQLRARAVRSVVEQTYRPLELVIVDNASCEPVVPPPCDIPVRVHRNDSPLTASRNRNVGVDLATGEFVCFLDDDDYYLPQKIARLLEARGSREWVYANTQMLGAGALPIGLCTGPPVLNKLMRSRYVHLNSILVPRSILQQIRFDENMTTYEDIDFVFRLLRVHSATHCDCVVAVWNRDGRSDQLTQRKLRRSFANWLILCRKFAREIEGDELLARFYFHRMMLLSAACVHPLEAFKFLSRLLVFGYWRPLLHAERRRSLSGPGTS